MKDLKLLTLNDNMLTTCYASLVIFNFIVVINACTSLLSFCSVNGFRTMRFSLKMQIFTLDQYLY